MSLSLVQQYISLYSYLGGTINASEPHPKSSNIIFLMVIQAIMIPMRQARLCTNICY